MGRLVVLLSLGLGGCTFAASGEDWTTQLDPAGPCYEANLLDGLDTGATEEAHAVFACLNGSGALDAYAPLDAALDGATREGPAGVVLARWLAALPRADLSLAGLVSDARELLAAPSALLEAAELAVELVYGAPWPWLGVSVPLDSDASLHDGLLVPLLPVAGRAAGSLLDDDLAALPPLAVALRATMTKRALWTLASVGTSSDPTLAGLDEDWAPDLSDALRRTANGDNDRWSGASGNSLGDLSNAVLAEGADGVVPLDALADAAAPLLVDTRLRDDLEAVLAAQVAAGRVTPLPAQLLYLASVDAEGGALSTGEDSALVALLRLLHDADAPLDCTLDLGLFDVDASFGNLSVSLLETLARQDAATVDGGVSLLGALLGVSLTDSVLDAVARSGVCPVIDGQLVADLHAVDRLADPETDELLLVLLDALAALDDRGQVPALVGLVSGVHARGLVPPVEEVLRDIADTALVGDLVALLPVLLDPLAYHDADAFPDGLPPLDYASAWDAVGSVLAVGPDGHAALAPLYAPARVLVADPATWTAVGRFGELAAQPDAKTTAVLTLLHDACAADPTLARLDDAAARIEDAALVRPLLVLAESEALQTALATTAPEQAGPIPFTARLVKGGTFAVLLDTLRALATLLPPETEE